MKISCLKKELSDVLPNLQRAVSAKTSLPVLEGILLKTGDNCLILSSYDLEIGMTTSISAQIIEPGDIVLNAKIFSDMVRKMPSEKIEIFSEENLCTSIKSGATEFSVIGIQASDFPEIPSLSESDEFNLPQNALLSMIRQTLFAISTDDTKPVLTGSLFEFTANSVRVTSVDGYRLATRVEPIQNKNGLETDFSFIIPGKTLSEISKMLDPESDEPILIHIGKRHILFCIGAYSIISRLLDGEFMDYKSILNQTFQTEVKVKVREFSDSVDRSSLLISERLTSPIRCVFSADSIQISSSTSIGKSHDEIPACTKGDTVEIGFNSKYLLDALRAADSDEIRVKLNGPFSPMEILPAEGEYFIFLVLPVRLDANG